MATWYRVLKYPSANKLIVKEEEGEGGRRWEDKQPREAIYFLTFKEAKAFALKQAKEKLDNAIKEYSLIDEQEEEG